jgi:hypothetical protein
MRAEFVAEVPQELMKGKYNSYLKKLYSGEEKCVVFTLDSQKELDGAYSAVRYNLLRHKDAGTFCTRRNRETCQLYVYKI